MNILLFRCPYCDTFQRWYAVLLPGDRIPCKCGKEMTVVSVDYEKGSARAKA